MEIKMIFPRRLRFAVFLICCMQLLHANAHSHVHMMIIGAVNTSHVAIASITSVNTSTTMEANSSSTTQENVSTTTNATTTTIIMMGNNTASVGETYTTGTPMVVTTKATTLATVKSTSTKASTTAIVESTSTKASTTATVESTSTIASTTATVESTSTKVSTTATVESTSTKVSTTAIVESSSTNAAATASTVSTLTTHSTTKAPVTSSSSTSTRRNVSFSIGSGTEYSSADCKSCSIAGGTITVTMSCSIKIKGSDDKKCDEDKFKETSCDYVTLVDKGYRCADVKKNYANYVEKKVNIVKHCHDVCPVSGSALSTHFVFTLSSVLAVGMEVLITNLSFH